MADNSAARDSRRNNCEAVLCEAEPSSSSSSSSASNIPQNEESSDEPVSFYPSDLHMDYFAAPSKVQADMGDSVLAITPSLQTGKNAESSPPLSTYPELDWIEPSTPIRSCVMGTSEDDSSCSSDSREGSSALSREKDAHPYIGDYTIVLHDVPMMDDSEELQQAEGASGRMDDEGGENEPPWRRCCLGAWLSEAGRSSTFRSIVLAAAVIGLVLVGSGWHRVRQQFQRFRCRFSSKGKGISQVMYQLVHVKGHSSSKLPPRISVHKAQSCFSGIQNLEPESIY